MVGRTAVVQVAAAVWRTEEAGTAGGGEAEGGPGGGQQETAPAGKGGETRGKPR